MNHLTDEDLDGITGAELEKRILEMAASQIATEFEMEVRRLITEEGLTLAEIFGDPDPDVPQCPNCGVILEGCREVSLCQECRGRDE